MQSIAFYQVDAFASRPFSGNPAAVLLPGDGLPEGDMQAIAEENNLPITAFLRPNGANWNLRWFTPAEEAGFCGHGTLAAAHVLMAELGVEGDVAFATRAGTLEVSRRRDGYALSLPRLRPERVFDPLPAIGEIAGCRPVSVFRTSRSWFVELADERAVRAFVPDLQAIAALHPLSFVVTAPGDEHDFVSRHFAPAAGVPEDAVTGSTHSTLVPYWSGKLGKAALSAFQCSPRGGQLTGELVEDRVQIVGSAVTYLRGTVSVR